MEEHVTAKNKIGLAIAAVLGVADCIALAFPTPEGEIGPPIGILVLSALCGDVPPFSRWCPCSWLSPCCRWS